jgi:hypothetical protein
VEIMGVEKISKEANYMGINGYIHSLKFNEQRLPDAAVLFRHDQELRWTTDSPEFKSSHPFLHLNGIDQSKRAFHIKSHPYHRYPPPCHRFKALLQIFAALPYHDNNNRQI